MDASYDALVELFRRIESIFKRLEEYAQVSFGHQMAEVFVEIAVVTLSILYIATKEVRRKRASEFLEDLLRARAFSYMIRILFRETVRKDRC